MQLRKMLSLIFELFHDKIDFLTNEEAKELRCHLSEIINFRNMFAHGQLLIDAPTSDVLIKHYHGGQKETVITDEKIQEFVGKCKSADEILRKLNEFFRENRLEY
ncbi:MAG: hypothetical protein ACQEW0_16785 [Pseudomonadota bacterium]